MDWIGYILVGGGFIITGVAWYAEINKVSKKPVILSGVIFGMILSLLAIYRANFITHGYDLASNVLFILGTCITAFCIVFTKWKKIAK
jgi:predicted permease